MQKDETDILTRDNFFQTWKGHFVVINNVGRVTQMEGIPDNSKEVV